MLNFKKFINEGVYDPGIFKIFFIAGGPGSGKSFVVNHIGFKALGLKIVNSDDILEYLLKSNNKNLDISNYSDKEKEEFNRIRNNAKRLTDNKMKNYISGRLGMIIDGTGANFDKIKKSSEIFKNLGYDSYMIFVNTSLEIALERNNSRERKLSSELVKEKWENVQKNIGKFQNYFGQMNFIVIDNNNINDEVLTKVYKRVLKIINFPIKNVIAKNWIKDQKLKKST